jgi:hypothetical protein
MPKEPKNPRDSEQSAPPKDQSADVCEVPGGDPGAKKVTVKKRGGFFKKRDYS